MSDSPAGSNAPSTQPSSIDNILRLAMNGVAPRPQAKSVEPDFGKAADLLERATSAIVGLTARRDELEQAAVAQEKVYEEKLKALQEETAEWERRAKVIKAHLQDCENRLSEHQVRIETLTYRAEKAEARAASAEQLASDYRKQAHLYHDKIMQTLGGLA